MPSRLTPQEFVAKWSPAQLSERAASHEHFLDLCNFLGQPTPAAHDATGAEYTFEKGVSVTAAASAGSQGERGFADVWWRGKFAWEYKRRGRHRTLDEPYRQLLQYREALENPPLLIVSDIERTEIHTNFTGTAKQVHTITLGDMAEPRSLDLLRRVFTDPHSFRPTLTPEHVTERVAGDFAALANLLRTRGHDPHDAAHFLMKCMFCLFAEDVKLLPEKIFERLLRTRRNNLASLQEGLTELFERMRTGGAFGVEEIPWFNGGLFDGSPALALTPGDVETLLRATTQDWGSVEPAIFGTLFERSLDPNARAQIGAHYTSREDIMLIVEPVIMTPLRREWDAVKTAVEAQIERRAAARTPATQRAAERAIKDALEAFVARLAAIRILDPACGSGNFLYVAIQQLLNLEKEVMTFAARPEIGLILLPQVRPTQLHGIEINPYAAELAQVVIWIGYLQWMRDNGYVAPANPILEPLQTIENRDAILDFLAAGESRAATVRERSPLSSEGTPSPPHNSATSSPASRSRRPTIRGSRRDQASRDGQRPPLPAGRGSVDRRPLAVPAQWPQADFIIGNPPFLGSKVFRANGLDDVYVTAMYAAYDLPRTSDLCCYWFEQARRAIERNRPSRVGLLATQGIRGGDNRQVLEKIKETGDIFMAWSDREWVLDGAAVHVSIIGFDRNLETDKVLDGAPVDDVHPNLTADTNVGLARILPENIDVSYMGDTKGGPFDIAWTQSRELLEAPNPNGRTSTDVLRPWVNGRDLTGRGRGYWIIDFGCGTTFEVACGYVAPFRFLERKVKPVRASTRQKRESKEWWLHVRPRPDMRFAIDPLPRFIFTTNTAKFRLFTWVFSPTLPDHAGIVFARSDDYFFGVLHSSIHELWALRMGTQLEDRPRYTPTTCFETFPLPWAPGREPAIADSPRSGANRAATVRERSPLGRGKTVASSHTPGTVPVPAANTGSRVEIPGKFQRATPTRSPLPDGRGSVLRARIGDAARELNEQRERWLNPPEWIDPIARAIDSTDDFADVPAEAQPLIRQSAIMAAAAKDARLKKRTLTNLYNERPTWLKLAHEKLDRAVLAAYAAVDPEGQWSEDWAEVWVETGAGQPLLEDHPLAARRVEIDPRVLANLLRMNLTRAESGS